MMALTMVAVAIASLYVDPPEPTMLVFPPFGHCMGIYRAGTGELAVLLGGLVRFDDPQGLSCVKLDEWDDPTSSDDDELAVYGVNSGSSHVIYNATMYTLGFYGGEGSGPTQLMHPHGVAAEPSGGVYVADTGNGRVVRLRREGQRMSPSSPLATGLSEPWDVALNGRGEIFVTDRAGSMLLFFESPSDSTPDTLCVDRPRGVGATGGERWSSRPDDFVVVVTGDGTGLLKLENLEPVASASLSSCGGSCFNYLAIDYFGNVWVTDSVCCVIHKFDRDLDYLDSFGSPGTGDRELDGPTGIAIWERFGQVFVAEREGARYFWIGTDVRDWELTETGRGFALSFFVMETSTILAEVTSPGGELVYWPLNGRFPAGEVACEWDGVSFQGTEVPEGEYELSVTLKATYSSRNYFRKLLEDSFSITEPPAPTERPERAGRNGG